MTPPLIYLLSDDLIDASKTMGAARAVGIVVKQFRQVAELHAALTQLPDLLILDLQTAALHMLELTNLGVPSIGYGSHVDTERLREARAAGFAKVMPRSQYFTEMPGHIQEWVRGIR